MMSDVHSELCQYLRYKLSLKNDIGINNVNIGHHIPEDTCTESFEAFSIESPKTCI